MMAAQAGQGSALGDARGAGATIHHLHASGVSSSLGLGSVASSNDDAPGAMRPVYVANAVLPVLPAPLALRNGPLLVTLQYWDDCIVADLPICALSGEGDTDTAALENLADVIRDWAAGIAKLGDANLGGALLRHWTAFKALVDVSGL